MSSNPAENTRRNFLKTAARGGIAVISLNSIVSGAMAFGEIHNKAEGESAATVKPDHVIRSIPQNMVWGSTLTSTVP